ncbi:glycoside hydrolase family 32 protein [Glutamicibacter endophyticus]|uniref:glycoside hydrolase family 32 protein n=1 Tax=Glutamicibacter endophyticus TaxID=1522174 RepID=UPI003AF197F9
MSQLSIAHVPRPTRHFTPAQHWMNDPNGLFFDGELYHLYFQYNPHGVEHGNMSWGHATSSDLVNWSEHPVAILHDERHDIFSGSIVIDRHNSSGLGDGSTAPVIALYTAAARDGSNQAQALAYSLDGGYSFTKYAGNPVLDRNSADFRDPKVFRYSGPAGDYWVMVAVEAVERRVLFYRSENLLEWDELSGFGPQAACAGVWECPDLLELPVEDSAETKWVLVLSLNPGGVAGGSGTQYFIGDFDGTSFTPDHEQPARDHTDFATLAEGAWLDWGRDNYAGVSFHGLPRNRCTLIAWMSNWDYARQLPHERWRGSMTTARKVDLLRTDTGYAVRQRFVGLPAAAAAESYGAGTHELALQGPTLIDVQARDLGEEPVRARFFRADGSPLSELLLGAQQISHQRPSGRVDHELYPSTQHMPLPPSDGRLCAQLLLDAGSLEVLAAGGLRSLTDQLTGEETPARVLLTIPGGAQSDVACTPLPQHGSTATQELK